MKRIQDKTQRRIRNTIISSAIICLTPLCEEGRRLSGAHSENIFAGREIVCAIDLGDDMYGSHGLETGFNYELINRFAADNRCEVRIAAADRNDDYVDSLKAGKVDLLITHDKSLGTETDMTVLSQMNDCSAWVLNSSCETEIRQFDRWIHHMKSSQEFERLKSRYTGTFNPAKRAEAGVTTATISPYDALIRKYAAQLGWDWRMVAAVVYQESRFSIGSKSSRGACGLMQVMPQTGSRYGVDNLLDPEQNIFAGTAHLKRLQRMFSRHIPDHEELIKFTLAAYNAGEGRIIDCRNLAESRGFDSTIWEETIKVIPLMREESILQEESVRLGKFYGHETIAYIESVLSHYQAICTICPEV